MEVDKLFELKLVKMIENKGYKYKRQINSATFMGEYAMLLQNLKKENNCIYVAFCNFKDFNLKVPSPTNFYGAKTYNIGLLNREIVLCPYDIENDNVIFDNVCLATF